MSDTTSTAAARAAALIQLGRPSEAETELRGGLSSDPQDPQLHLDLTRVLLMQGRNAEALESSQTALALAPDEPFVLYIRGLAQAANDLVAAASETLDSALRLAPEWPALHVQRGHLHHVDNRPGQALEHFRVARALDPEDAETVAAEAAALFDLRRTDEAARAVDDALRLDPECAPAHHVRGLLALRSGAGREALDSGRESVRLDPTNENRRELLGTTMKARNPLYRALWRYSDWLEGLPSNVKWVSLLAPLLLLRALRATGGGLWVNVVIGVVIALVALTWVLEPLMNTVLLASAFGRGLLPAATKRATCAFAAFMSAALGGVVWAVLGGPEHLYLAALGAALWSASTGMFHSIPKQSRAGWAAAAVAGALTVLIVLGTAAGAAFVWPVTLALLVSGLASLWFVSIAANRD